MLARRFEADVQDKVKQCSLVLERRKAEFLKLFGTDQFGVGLKMKEGRFTPEVCLVFIVRRKLTDKTLKEFKIEIVPHTIEDVPTDVIEVPYGFEARQNDDRGSPFLGGDGSNERKALELLFAGGRTTEGTDITIASPIEFVVREAGYTL